MAFARFTPLIRLISLALLIGTVMPFNVHAQEGTGQGEEFRTASCEVDGYAFMGGNSTLNSVREEANIHAKKQCLQNANTYIQSMSVVKNMELDVSIQQATSGGFVKVLESKDYGLENLRYHVWIKAEVRYSVDKPPSSNPDYNSPLLPLTVKMWTEKRNYRQGEKMSITIKGNKDFYGQIYYQDAGGNMILLLPNGYRTDNFFKGDEEIVIPGEEDQFELEIMEPYGKEELLIFASTAPLAEIEGQDAGKGLRLVDANREGIRNNVRGLKVTGGKVNKTAVSRNNASQNGPDNSLSGETVENYETSWTVITRP